MSDTNRPSRDLLSYDDALVRVLAAVQRPMPAYHGPLPESAGRVLAENVFAPENLPPFDNSAVDGFAIGEVDFHALQAAPRTLNLGSEIRAGGNPSFLKNIPAGIAIPIYTGAPVPPGIASIVMVEDSERLDPDSVQLMDAGSPAHIRLAGSDVPKGGLAAPAGTLLDAGVIGLLSALNVGVVPYHRAPRIGIITTGDELVNAFQSEPLQPGQIRDSNRWALRVAAKEAGGIVAETRHAYDTPEDVQAALNACARAGCDVIVTCGGVSVGAHDYVKDAVQQIGTLDFWRIAIKPGKPLAFGQIGGALYFGLPGNPVSSLVTFELFVRPVLRKLAGHRDVTRQTVSAILDEPLSHEPGRREFVRARLSSDGESFHATLTGPQGSHRLHSLLGANAYLIAHEDRSGYPAGAVIPALLLD